MLIHSCKRRDPISTLTIKHLIRDLAVCKLFLIHFVYFHKCTLHVYMMFMIYVIRAFHKYLYMMFIIAKGMLPKHSSFFNYEKNQGPNRLYCIVLNPTKDKTSCTFFIKITCLLQNMYIRFISTKDTLRNHSSLLTLKTIRDRTVYSFALTICFSQCMHMLCIIAKSMLPNHSSFFNYEDDQGPNCLYYLAPEKDQELNFYTSNVSVTNICI